MSGSTIPLSEEQLSNIQYIIKRMGEMGLTNPYIQAGILAIISKESSFKPKSERDYAGTSNSRIRKIFGSRVSGMTDEQITALKNDPKQFFDRIYGGRYGNAANEGYKYRGRGFNQLTFKSNYESINRYTTKDIVADPDSLNELPTATEAVIGYFERAFSRPNAKLSLYNMTTVNDANNTLDAVGVAYHANTGWGKSKAQIEADPTGGYRKALDRVDQFYVIVKESGEVIGKESTEEDDPVVKIIDTGIVSANILNVRTGPGTDYDKSGTLTDGDTVNIYAKQGRWLKISAKGERWVHGNYVEEQGMEMPLVLTTGNVTVRLLNIRKGPGTNFDQDGRLTQGETVSVYAKDNEWYKISPTAERWVHSNYVDTAAPTEPLVIATGKVTAKILNIRTGAGTDFNKNGTLKRGDVVKVYEKDGGWLKISSHEPKWVHGNYVDE